MKYLLPLLFITMSNLVQAQIVTRSNVSSRVLLDSISEYLRQCDQWETAVCPVSSYNPEDGWRRDFYYAVAQYPKTFVDSPDKVDHFAITIDTTDLAIYFPFQDCGGPGKASGSSESFWIFLKNIESISLDEDQSKISLHLRSYDNNPLAEYFQTNNCYKVNYGFSYLKMSFSNVRIPFLFIQKLESLLGRRILY